MSAPDPYSLWLAAQGGMSGYKLNNPDRMSSAAGGPLNGVNPPMVGSGPLGMASMGDPFGSSSAASMLNPYPASAQQGPPLSMIDSLPVASAANMNPYPTDQYGNPTIETTQAALANVQKKPGLTTMFDPQTGITYYRQEAGPGQPGASWAVGPDGKVIDSSYSMTNPASAASGNTPQLGSLLAEALAQGKNQASTSAAATTSALPTTTTGGGTTADILARIQAGTQSTNGGRGATIQDIVDQAGSGYGSLGNSLDIANPQTSAFGSSGLPVNEEELSKYIWSHPELAIGMSGVAGIGTPGYNNLNNMGFDPYAVFLAAGGDFDQTGTQYAGWLGNMYNTLGSLGNDGGGSIHAGPLLANLVAMGPGTDLGGMMAEDPTVFYQMATEVVKAGGLSPMATSAFKSQMANLMSEYMTYTSTNTAKDTLSINQWIAKQHPDIVASWQSGG